MKTDLVSSPNAESWVTTHQGLLKTVLGYTCCEAVVIISGPWQP